MGYSRVLCLPRSRRMAARGPGCVPTEVCHCVASQEGGRAGTALLGRGLPPCTLAAPTPAPDSLNCERGWGGDFSSCIFCLSVARWSGTLGGLGSRG